jgi:hypothetical protein
MRARRLAPATVRRMAWHRGLIARHAKRGGWYVMLSKDVIYAAHDWGKVEAFIKQCPILIKRSEAWRQQA